MCSGVYASGDGSMTFVFDNNSNNYTSLEISNNTVDVSYICYYNDVF